MINVHADPFQSSSVRWAEAFKAGCPGSRLYRDFRLRPGDVAAFGSERMLILINQAISEGRTWYYGDHAYFRRSEYFRITRNAWQETDIPYGLVSDDRWNRLGIPIEPWKKGGDHIVVCVPSPHFGARQNFNTGDWVEHVKEVLRQYTNRPIIMREKPKISNGIGPLSEALNGAHALICHRSNAAVEALMMGYPVFTLRKCAAWPLARHQLSDIENPYYPDHRLQLAAHLANRQWTLSEVASGLAWRTLNGEP